MSDRERPNCGTDPLSARQTLRDELDEEAIAMVTEARRQRRGAVSTASAQPATPAKRLAPRPGLDVGITTGFNPWLPSVQGALDALSVSRTVEAANRANEVVERSRESLRQIERLGARLYGIH